MAFLDGFTVKPYYHLQPKRCLLKCFKPRANFKVLCSIVLSYTVIDFSADKELAEYVESIEEIISAEPTYYEMDFEDFDDTICDGSKIEYYINGKFYRIK